jgi:hypothetical protein
MPFLFPEVFLRESPGFDVILGNPPWEELVYEEIKFWTLRNPGLRGKPIKEQLKIVAKLQTTYPDLYLQMQSEMNATNSYRKILMSGPYKGMGSGHADLYKAFCWRFQQLSRDGGYVGVVLPRGALTAAGSSDWRQDVISTSHFVQTVFLANTSGWVFPSVHSQYSIGLVVIQKNVLGKTILAGPFTSEKDFKSFGSALPEPMLEGKSILDWSETFAFPLLPSTDSVEVFTKLRRAKSLGLIKEKDFEFSPVQGDFNQTTDRDLVFLDNLEKGELLAYKGASFNLWTPSTGELLGSASKAKVDKYMNAKLSRSSKMASSAFYNMKRNKNGEFALTYEQPRIAMRLITNQTNTRTVISCLVPPGVILGNGAPFLVRRAGDEKAEAFLLGILSSIPLDWYARRFVELNMNFHILNGFPIPEYSNNTINNRIVELAGALASVDKQYALWAKAVGVKVGTISEESEREEATAEIDALVAISYNLSREDLIHIFETFHKGWDYNERLKAALKHFDAWSKK